MKFGRKAAAFAIVILAASAAAHATERPVDFVRGLRERGYFDTALDYLESLRGRGDLPADVRATIPYEMAATLTEWARVQRNPEKAVDNLARARVFYEEFVKTNPDHPLAAQANTELAQTLLQKAKSEIVQARSPGNQRKKAELLRGARGQLEQARKLFQAASERNQAEWKKFPVFVDQAQEPEQYAARSKAEGEAIQSRVHLAIVTYEEAQTHETNSSTFNRLLNEAALEFEKIYSQHRNQVAALYARMYQGKCYEEQGEFQKALGIYDELLARKDENPTVARLQDQVTHFKLICLNQPKQHDHQLAATEAEAWLKANPTKSRTKLGTGIRWELARAEEALSKAPHTPAEQKVRWLTQALTNARLVSKIAGEHQDAAQALVQRATIALDREPGVPKDFEAAFAAGRTGTERVKELSETLAAATGGEKAKLKQELKLHLDETARTLRRALSLVKSDTPLKEVNSARYLMAYVDYLQERNYDAAIEAEFVARRHAKHEESGSVPLDAAYLALAAYAQASLATHNKSPEVDLKQIQDLLGFMSATWPQNDKTYEAFILIGKLYSRSKQPSRAAEWFSKVPETSSHYLDAQLDAGRAFWTAHLTAHELPEGERPSAEQLAEYQASARKILQTALTTSEAKLGAEERLPDELFVAKFMSAQMANASGDYDEAVKLLATGSHPLLPALKLDLGPGESPPATGPHSRQFAGEVYRQLLRAYIGLQNLDAAKQAMGELEKIETELGRNDVGPLYMSLGKQFKEELDRLAKTDKAQFQVVLKSFETFLQSMLDRQDGLTYNSLAWISETYFALGQGLVDEASSKKYFDKAAKGFDEIIRRSAADPKFATPAQLLAVQARLVGCKRRAGQYDEALKLVKEVLKNRPNALDAQIEAAHVYQAWAESGKKGAAKQWDKAILGVQGKQKGAVWIWGWGEIANRLAAQLESGPPNKTYQDDLLDARYNLAVCRRGSAMSQANDADRRRALEQADKDISFTIALHTLEGAWYDKFNALHREIQLDLGRAAKPLEKGGAAEAAAGTAKNGATQKKGSKAVAAKGSKSKTQKSPKSAAKAASLADQLLIAFLVIAAAGGCGFIYYYVKRPKRARKLTPLAPASSYNPLADE